VRRPPRYRDSIKNKKPCLGDRKLGATPAKRIAPVFALMTLDRNRSGTAARERQAIFLGPSRELLDPEVDLAVALVGGRAWWLSTALATVHRPPSWPSDRGAAR
jgi:hypothetical protein